MFLKMGVRERVKRGIRRREVVWIRRLRRRAEGFRRLRESAEEGRVKEERRKISGTPR